jgi:cytosine deaminase
LLSNSAGGPNPIWWLLPPTIHGLPHLINRFDMLILRRARVPSSLLPSSGRSADSVEPAELCDIVIDGMRIAAVGPSESISAMPGVTESDLGGALVFPGFIDAHVHLDKAHTWDRAPNRSATFWDALTTLGADAKNWSAADLERRAEFSLRCAYAHGTRIIRTHVDTGFPQAEISHGVMAMLRERWTGRIELQTVPLCGIADFSLSTGAKIIDLAKRTGASALGGFAIMSPELPAQFERQLAAARECGMGLDLHVDENGNPASEILRMIAEAVLRTEFPYPVVCGHCCSLAVQAPARQRETIALVKAAGLKIISLPMCNLYLQDRRPADAFPNSPSWRGLTPVRDLLAAGVSVACASDNVRDAFFAYGDFDMCEVYSESVRLAHLDTRVNDSVRTVTAAAADSVGCSEYGRIAVGAPAHLVISAARSFSEFLSRPTGPRRRVDGETIHAPVRPDYAELG